MSGKFRRNFRGPQPRRDSGDPFGAYSLMMYKWWGVGVWGGLWLVACGGKLVDSGSLEQAGAPAAGAPASAGRAGASSGGTGNLPGGGGASLGGAPPTCPPESKDIFCTTWCGSDNAAFTAGVCIDGAWRCPAPLIEPESCPPDACILQRVTCCDHEYGKLTLPPCGADGSFGPCPTGTERNAKLCVADSAHTTDCGSLTNGQCSLAGARCDLNHVHCECIGGDGGMVWSCMVDLL